jgi:hypothetical protein
MLRRHNRILGAALLLPVILLSAVWTGFGWWRCQSDGVARAHCCCPVKAPGTQPEAPTHATLSSQRCCAFEQHHVDRNPSDTARAVSAAQPDATLPPPAIASSLLLLADPAPAVRPWLPQANVHRTGPLGGRALVVHKQSFLI